MIPFKDEVSQPKDFAKRSLITVSELSFYSGPSLSNFEFDRLNFTSRFTQNECFAKLQSHQQKLTVKENCVILAQFCFCREKLSSNLFITDYTEEGSSRESAQRRYLKVVIRAPSFIPSISTKFSPNLECVCNPSGVLIEFWNLILLPNDDRFLEISLYQ